MISLLLDVFSILIINYKKHGTIHTGVMFFFSHTKNVDVGSKLTFQK